MKFSIIITKSTTIMIMYTVAVRDVHRVLIDVDVGSALIVGDPQWILGQHLRPH